MTNGIFIETHSPHPELTTMDPEDPARRRAALERQGLLNPDLLT